MALLNWIIEPLGYSFFQRALLAGALMALACGILSPFIIWRGMSFIGDALSHSILPGLVVALIFGFSLQIGAFLFAILAVLGISFLAGPKGFKEDTAIGIISSGAFATGILLLSSLKTSQDLTHILFGSILGISVSDLILISVLCLIIFLCIIIFYKELLATSFDVSHAIAIGISPRLIQIGLLILIACATVTAVQTIGVALILALLVTPAAAASIFLKKLSHIIVLSIMIAFFSVLAGLYISFYLNLACGACIVIILSLVFFILYIVKKIKINILIKNLPSKFKNR